MLPRPPAFRPCDAFTYMKSLMLELSREACGLPKAGVHAQQGLNQGVVQVGAGAGGRCARDLLRPWNSDSWAGFHCTDDVHSLIIELSPRQQLNMECGQSFHFRTLIGNFGPKTPS